MRAFELVAGKTVDPPSRSVMTPVDSPRVARFAVVSDLAPRITEALSLGERCHRALVSRCAAPVFTGCDTAGQPLGGGHQHAFYLSECELQRGRVKFLTLFARMGFDAEGQCAIEQFRQTRGYDGHKLQLILLGVGERADFAGKNADAGQSLLLCSAKEWVSLTPFVPTRHLKTRNNGTPKRDDTGFAIGSPEHDLRRLLKEAGFPEPSKIKPVSDLTLGAGRIRWLEFQRTRKHGNGARAGERGHGFRITFPGCVDGPIAVGYGAHFGLGLFIPANP